MLAATRRAPAAAAVTTVLTALLATGLSAPSPATAAGEALDPERVNDQVTLSDWTPVDSTADYVQDLMDLGAGRRPVDIEVTSVVDNQPRFAAQLVVNAGVYQRGNPRFFPQLTQAEARQRLTALDARPLDVERYVAPNLGIRYALTTIDNTGIAEKDWRWLADATATQVSGLLRSGFKITDLERRLTLEGTRYDVLAIKRVGVDSARTWHYTGRTTTEVRDLLRQNSARPLDIERNGTRWDVVMQPVNGRRWWWYPAVPVDEKRNLERQLGARTVRYEPFTNDGESYASLILVDNVDPETKRIRNLVSARMRGSWGFMVRRVGDQASTIGLNQAAVFEPASMLKIVHAVAAFREIEADGIDYLDPITWYARQLNPARYPGDTRYQVDKNVCAYDDDGSTSLRNTHSDPIGPDVVRWMMRESDNRRTDALVLRYGFDALNDLMDQVGMSSSHLYHRIGCPGASTPGGTLIDNELTLVDAGRIYEQIVDNTLLNPSNEQLLFSNMLGGAVPADSSLGTMIRTEADRAGLTPAQTTTFLTRTTTRSKGGSYGRCPATGDCETTTLQHRTVGGVMWLPFKVGGSITPRSYVYGRFVNAQFPCSFEQVKDKTCTSFQQVSSGLGTIGVEMFRKIVRQALATW